MQWLARSSAGSVFLKRSPVLKGGSLSLGGSGTNINHVMVNPLPRYARYGLLENAYSEKDIQKKPRFFPLFGLHMKER